MKQSTLFYSCRLQGSKIHFRVDYWPVGNFPISFTPKECLEEWCEMVGWRLLSYEDSLDATLTYSFRCEHRSYENTGRTILENHYPHSMRAAWG